MRPKTSKIQPMQKVPPLARALSSTRARTACKIRSEAWNFLSRKIVKMTIAKMGSNASPRSQNLYWVKLSQWCDIIE